MSKLIDNNSLYTSIRGLINDSIYNPTKSSVNNSIDASLRNLAWDSLYDSLWNLIIKIKDNTK